MAAKFSTSHLHEWFQKFFCAFSFAPPALYHSNLFASWLFPRIRHPKPPWTWERTQRHLCTFCVSLWISSVTFPTLCIMALTEPTMIPLQKLQKAKVSFFSAWIIFPCFTTRWESETGLTQLLPSLSRQEFRGEKRTEKCPKVIPQTLPPQGGIG